ATTLANHTYAPESSMPCKKLRYQSKEMGGLPVSGTLTALAQKPFSASPVSIQAGLLSLCEAASTQARPSRTRTTAQTAAKRVSSNRKRASGGLLMIVPVLVLT